MVNKKFLWAGMTLLLLASLFAVVQNAMAVTTPTCGISNIWTDGVLQIKKNVFCEKDSIWSWDILKSADASSLTLSEGQVYTVNYTIDVTATNLEGNFAVYGQIRVRNHTDFTDPPGYPVTVDDIVDSLGPVVCPALPVTLLPGQSVNCTYSGELSEPAEENVATAYYDSTSVSATAPIDWTLATTTEIDECADINDTYAGFLGTVCADDQNQSFTFTYSRDIGPYEACGYYTVENTADFLTNDTGTTGDSTWIIDVTVPCEGGCTLTPGYWKTHSAYGPAPYDETWAMLPNGEDTPFFLSGVSYYDALWTSPQGNAYWILAHAYIAAQLNDLNGADFGAAQAAFDAATVLFNTYTPAQIGALKGADPIRAQFISLATTLDNYNNGLIGPGHCDE